MGLIAAVMAAGGVGVLALDALFPPLLDRYLDRSVSVVDSEGEPLRAFPSGDVSWRFPARADEVSPLFLRMLVAYEDRRFYRHPGVDPVAVARALGQWAANGRVVSGASTLTMQVVRLLEPRPRTLAAKIVEMARALQLERHFDKDEILGMYLTLAPYGGNLEGIEAASRFYFGRSPLHLTAGEAALLVILPRSPSRLRPDRFPVRARAARAKVLRRLRSVGLLSVQQVAEAEGETLPESRRPAPFMAAHLARRLRHERPGRDEIATFIIGGLQAKVEALAKRHLGRLEAGANIAVLVAENATGKVRAYLGSADFFDEARRGQVDMVRAVRSPGSTLKPFIFGAAFETLNLHPETLITDAPRRFGDYAPVNFDNRYRGEVTLREALQLSLNLPAVALLDRLGPGRFAASMKEAGAEPSLDPGLDRPALPMALGGVGMRLWDLVTLYAGLARLGMAAPLRLTEDDPRPEPRRFLGEVAAWYVRDVLRGTPPPAPRISSRLVGRWRGIALKTGTSYGFRDAWAIGFDNAYTVGVWVGRPDGGFRASGTGRADAAPIVYDLFDLLPTATGPTPTRPEGVVLAGNRELPPPLRRFRRRADLLLPVSRRERMEILFPPDGVTLDIAFDGPSFRPPTLEARGGRKPLHWLVNGKPLASLPFRRKVSWTSIGEGRSRITVIDGVGKTAAAVVWVRRRSAGAAGQPGTAERLKLKVVPTPGRLSTSSRPP